MRGLVFCHGTDFVGKIMSVSYTHLDVYKRQRQWRASAMLSVPVPPLREAPGLDGF